MSHKRKRHHNKEKVDISEDDKIVINLLSIQSQAIKVYLIADVFFYEFAITVLKYVYIKNLDNSKVDENILLINGCGLSLIASVVLSEISFTAFERLHNKDINGELDYSTNPEEGIAMASIYTILLFFINLIGAIGLYKRVNICEVKISPYWIMLLNIQVKAYEIRFLADYLALTASLESIELVKSKYSKSHNNMPNPDIPALIAAILYLVQRVMLFYVSYEVYVYMIKECGEVVNLGYLEPNRLPIIASIFGIIADIIALNSFIEIYQRDIDRPIFGR